MQTVNHPFRVMKAKSAKGANFGCEPDREAFYVFDTHTLSEVAGPFDTRSEALAEARKMER